MSIGILEFLNIAEAYFIIDKVLKGYNLSVLKAMRICPGKFLAIFSGNTADIISMIKYIEEQNLNTVKFSYVTGIHKETVNAITGKKETKNIENIGIIEVKNAVNSFIILNTLVTSFPISIIKIDYSMGLFGKAIIFINGNQSDIENAIKISYEVLSQKTVTDARVISSPCEEFIACLVK